MLGYRGKILDIDLSKGEIKEINIDEKIYRNYIGGSGFGAWLFADRLISANKNAKNSEDIAAYFKNLNPLGSENPLIFTTGPLTCTRLPGAATRFSVAAKSPLTDIWGECSCGGTFGFQIKSAGYDGVVFTGISSNPVYLFVADEKIELRNAQDLWGKDAYDTIDILKARIKENDELHNPTILSIGQAGENLVNYACIINDKRNAAGRCGLGAVMGSKKLKAVVVRGSKKVDFAEPEQLENLRKSLLEKIKNNVIVQSIGSFGTAGAMDLGSMLGDVPIKGWQVGDWSGCEEISGPKMSDAILTKRDSCYLCPVACKRVVKADDEKYNVPESAGPEYETLGSFGTNLFNDNLNSIAKIHELCNRYGLDPISCGGTIVFAVECFEKGILTEKDTDGLILSWGNADAAIELIKKIAILDGFGSLLAKGSKKLSNKIGKNSEELLCEVKGMEAPMHDPRAFHGMGLAYATSNRGACHVNSLQMWFEHGYAFYPKMGLGEPMSPQVSEEKAEANVKTQNMGGVFNSAEICFFPGTIYDEDDQLNSINFSTGFNYSFEELLECGARIWILKRAINNFFGITAKDDRLPKKILTPVEDGGAAGSAPDIELMLQEFYELRGLDESGKPTDETLENLGLDFLAGKL